ncbi:MAG TPA: calcium-binding protein, partial [Baekduia sp.]|nr:calcium-binding protein [Baekduia sp.]
DRLEGGDGDDWMDGGQGADIVIGGDGQDVIVLLDPRPELGYQPRRDHIEAGPGNDIIRTHVPLTYVDCGPGNDVLYGKAEIPVNCERIVEDLRKAPALPFPHNGGYLRGGAERAMSGSLGEAVQRKQSGTPGPDEIHGADIPANGLPDADLILGKAGDDVLVGHGGDDHLEGEAGHDLLLGGVGNDQLFGRTGVDRLDGGDGHDTLEGGRGTDRLSGGEGNDRLNGGIDNDELRGGPGRDVIVATGGGRDWIDCGPGVDIVVADSVDVVHNCERLRGGFAAKARKARKARRAR